MIEFIIVILFQKSGAYIFRPNNSMTFPIGDNPEISLVEVSLCYFGLIVCGLSNGQLFLMPLF